MLNDNYLWQFFLAFFPALVYSYIIYFNDRNNITLRKTLSYIIGGCISISFLSLFILVFPKFQKMLFTIPNGMIDLSTMTVLHEPTLLSWIIFAFIQVALLEESVKALAWGTVSWFKKNEYSHKDTLFSTMFYSCMISVGFAGIENLHYMIGYQDSSIFLERSLSAVIAHMVCGILMGYFIAISRLKRDVMHKVGYQLLGVLAASLFHGTYDFVAMTMGNLIMPIKFPLTNIYVRGFHVIILIGLILATICGRSLLNYSLRYGRIQRTRNPLPPVD